MKHQGLQVHKVDPQLNYSESDFGRQCRHLATLFLVALSTAGCERSQADANKAPARGFALDSAIAKQQQSIDNINGSITQVEFLSKMLLRSEDENDVLNARANLKLATDEARKQDYQNVLKGTEEVLKAREEAILKMAKDLPKPEKVLLLQGGVNLWQEELLQKIESHQGALVTLKGNENTSEKIERVERVLFKAKSERDFLKEVEQILRLEQ